MRHEILRPPGISGLCWLVVALSLLCSLPRAFSETAPQVIPAATAQDKLNLFGRTLRVGPAIAFDWSYSGFEFEADCSGEVRAAITGTPGWQKVGYIQVTVDGVSGERIAIQPGPGDYVLASDLAQGRHRIQVHKLNEAQYFKLALESLSLTGTLLAAPAAPALKMEFIGDSISCAEGALGRQPAVPQGESQDAARSYPALTAKNLGASANIVAASSWGLYRGRISPPERSVIPSIYELASRFRDPAAPWDFSRYQPDIVVVNLGTNDFGVRKKSPFTDEEFESAIESFHHTLREHYPAAEIFWVSGMMMSEADGPTQAAVEKIHASDPKIHYVLLPRNKGGGNGHPDLDGHAKAAVELTARIREAMPHLPVAAP
ncbi:hypothetical protein BH09VER1_BH09VER1_27520 [soil metagenome]